MKSSRPKLSSERKPKFCPTCGGEADHSDSGIRVKEVERSRAQEPYHVGPVVFVYDALRKGVFIHHRVLKTSMFISESDMRLRLTRPMPVPPHSQFSAVM